MIEKLGVQAYSFRQYYNEEGATVESVTEVFKQIKAMGYDEVQSADYGKLTREQYAEAAHAAGLSIIGTHENYYQIRDNTEEMMRIHEEVLPFPSVAASAATVMVGRSFSATLPLRRMVPVMVITPELMSLESLTPSNLSTLMVPPIAHLQFVRLQPLPESVKAPKGIWARCFVSSFSAGME